MTFKSPFVLLMTEHMLVLKPILTTSGEHKHAAKWLWLLFHDTEVFLSCEKSEAPVSPLCLSSSL